jgi:UDP-xylose:glucoside alpha-1,3-xylosyltransferase
MDTDTIFLTSPLQVWEHFNKMNKMQMAAVAPEHEDFLTGLVQQICKTHLLWEFGYLFVES